MRKTLIFSILAILTFSATAVHSSQHEPLRVHGEVDAEDKNFYPEQRTVEFPAVKSGDETVRYSNASYEEYVSWQVKDKGLQTIRKDLKSNLSLKGIRTGSTAESIEITFIENQSIEREFSYQELEQLVPPEITGSYEINGEQVNTSVDVVLERKEDSRLQEKLDYSRASASESFGSSNGPDYNASFKILNTTQGEHTGEQVKNLSVTENSVSFIGSVELGQPCDKINKTYEQKNSELVLKVDTYSTGKPCVDVVAFKKYSFNIESKQLIRLEVRHNGQEVRTVQTAETHSDEAGIVSEIVNIIQNLF